ncbi:MAG: RnfABCDGE type electron transport complex subunit B [Lachnospiraceae bacterium]|jgi:electron transport complex protein RnfB
MSIIIATIVIGGVGLFVGFFLGFASKAFHVEVDQKEIDIRACLPGANCGACGYPGCDGVAAAIAQGKAPVNACPVGGEEAANKIAEIMGATAGDSEKMVAFVRCTGDCEKTTEKYDYSGPKSCSEAFFVPSHGPKSCSFGCTGFGDCVAACGFDAISIERGIAKVDPEKCKDCKKCIDACPKGIIIEVPYGRNSHIACVNPTKGKPVMSACKASCIKCQKCAKQCPAGAIDFTKGYPTIDYSKCTDCGACKEACPRKCII